MGLRNLSLTRPRTREMAEFRAVINRMNRGYQAFNADQDEVLREVALRSLAVEDGHSHRTAWQEMSL